MEARWEDAANRGDVQDVRDLLDKGTDVDARNHHGQTALMLAAHAAHLEVVSVLVAHRANLNMTTKYGLSALMLALVAGHVEVATLFSGRRNRSASAWNGGIGLHWQDGVRSCC
jgi:ankyrin repeat protein